MNLELRIKYLSESRYNRYLAATGNNNNRAKKLYNANIRLTQAFHPLLTQFEVVLRNSLNVVLTRHFADDDWIINQKTGFMQDPSLRSSNFFMRSCIQKAENKLSARSIPITSGKIISDQSFGFWVSFFLAHHYSMIAGQAIHAFPNKPSYENRASIHGRLEVIKSFRNRINHCEPICFTGPDIDCSYALNVRTELHNLVNWIEPGLIPFFTEIDSVAGRTRQIISI